jgi:hypothetical protein
MTDNDTISVAELRTAIRHLRSWTAITTHDLIVNEIAEWIFAHREPEFPEGTVIKDADGKFWRRHYKFTAHPTWEAFGLASIFEDTVPCRPLEIVS